jgi:hypothetical protein
MTYDLEDIELLELSLVDAPANQHASVVLFKRSGYTDGVKPEMQGKTAKGEGPVTVEELTKKLEALQAQVTDLTKKAEDAEMTRDEEAKAREKAEANAAALTKSVEDAGLDVKDGKVVKRADPEYVEIGGEKVEKSLVPAPVLKAIEAQAAAIAKMEAAAQEVELTKRGDAELPNLAGTGLAKGRLLAAIGQDEAMLNALKAAESAMAAQFVEKGHGNVHDEASPAYKLDQLAKAHAAAQSVSFETAYAEVTKAGVGADLLGQVRNQAN